MQKKRQNFDKKIGIAELCKGVHCVDLGVSFQRIFTCKIWLRYSRERALQNLADRRAPPTHTTHSQIQTPSRTGLNSSRAGDFEKGKGNSDWDVGLTFKKVSKLSYWKLESERPVIF